MTEGRELLLPGQARAAEMLLTTARIGDVAKEINVSRQTLSTWLHHDARFRVYLAEREAEQLEQAARRLVSLCVKAANTLEVALDGSEVETTALRAADIVLRRAPPLLEAALVHVRLAQLEKRLAGLG